jgi:cell shape-determining protein MreC
MELKIADSIHIVMEDLISESNNRKILEQTDVTNRVIDLIMDSFSNTKEFQQCGLYQVTKNIITNSKYTFSLALIDDNSFVIVDKRELKDLQSKKEELDALKSDYEILKNDYNDLKLKNEELSEKINETIIDVPVEDVQEVSKEVNSIEGTYEEIEKLSAMH